MSAYAALVSLRQNLVGILHPEPRIIHSRAQLQILLHEVVFLLKFLDDSSTYKASQISALETKTRDAAHKAEDLIEYGILDSETRISYDSIRMMILLSFYNIVVIFISVWIHESYASVWMGLILELVLCMMNAMVLYLHIRKEYIFPAINDSHELSQVIYDFNIIVKEITEAGGEPEMSAQATLSSLRQILDPILDSHGRRISRSGAHLKCLHEKVSSLLEFLGNTPTAYMSTINDAVFKAKIALIEFQPPTKFISVDFDYTLKDVSLLISSPSNVNLFFRVIFYWVMYLEEKVSFCFVILWRSCIIFASFIGSAVIVFLVLAAQYHSKAPEKQELLSHSVDDFTSILKDVTEDASGDSSGSRAAAAASASSRRDMEGAGRDVIVGLDKVLIDIKYSLLQGSPKRQLVSIVGMGGIGKTTLARRVYEDLRIDVHFDFCSWVTVSQDNSLRHALLSLLDSANLLTDENRQDDDEKLAVYLYKHLKYRRYLIVIDDVWDNTEIWDFLSIHFPENNNGSHVLLTSRLPNVVSRLDSSSCLHYMQCLNENHSWDLLCTQVFRVVEGCPRELESIGRKIAKRCGGLPLAIVVIGGLLRKDTRVDVWTDVAEKLEKIEVQDIKERCLDILGLSYNNLPHHLRPCFLYMGAFLRDGEILISRLVNLWVAEGFLQPRTGTLEEVAERYLEDLIKRNLIMVCKRSCSGKTKTCSMHDLLRDVCVQNARKENFLHVVDSGGYVTRERFDESPRRLSIHRGALQVDAKYDSVRSVLCFASKPTKKSLVMYLGLLCLRVLDLLEVQFGEFPHQVTKLRHLRHLAFHYNGSIPPSISKLQNLETIVHHHSSSHKYPSLPRVIWSMRNLRHIYVKPGCYLSNPLSLEFPSTFTANVLHLQTLVGVRNFKWSKGIIKRISNLKKLGISYDVPSSVDWSAYQFDCLADLHKLETLKIIIKYDDDAGSAIYPDPPKLAFPQKLKKLSLSGSRIPWESMTAIGTLPNLEALKLRCEAFCGPSWETIEGEFPRLVFLLLEEMSFTTWESEESHFPHLQRLVLRSCFMLEKIPSSIGDMERLDVIELDDCPPSVVASARQIEEEQSSSGKEVSIKFHNERRRVVDETTSEAKGMGPGVFQLVSDAFQSARNEIMMFSDPLALAILVRWSCMKTRRLIWRWFLSGKFWLSSFLFNRNSMFRPQLQNHFEDEDLFLEHLF